MTHASLSESCIRPPGTPPSRCPGELVFTDSRIDTAQAHEGELGDAIAVDFYRCGRCRQTVVVRHAADCWYLVNEMPELERLERPVPGNGVLLVPAIP